MIRTIIIIQISSKLMIKNNDSNNNDTNKIITGRHELYQAKNTRLVAKLWIALAHLSSSASLD